MKRDACLLKSNRSRDIAWRFIWLLGVIKGILSIIICSWPIELLQTGLRKYELRLIESRAMLSFVLWLILKLFSYSCNPVERIIKSF